MNVRKLFDWRKLLLYTHRWMGIVFGLIFIVWFISGIAFMYVGMPSLSVNERLGHMKPLDLSTARLSPAEAAKKNDIEPGRFTMEMHYDGRPVYRFASTKVYADTGDPVAGMNEIQAVNFIRQWVPQHASTARYDAYLEDSDQWTLQNAQRQFMPVHRIAAGDPAGTVYYVSERTGEPVMKTDRRARFWGFTSGVLHWTYFTALRRHSYFWNKLVAWGSIAGAFMCLTGIVAGVWRFGIRKLYRIKGVQSRSPYAGWMWWHHYAGLIFGFLTLTWAFSGALSLTPFQSLRGGPVTQEQRRAVSGARLDMESITVERLIASLKAFTPSFTPKELELLEFRGKAYFIGRRPPADYDFDSEAGSHAERYQPPRGHLIVAALAPEYGAFQRFDDDVMWKIAQEAMPGVAIQDSAWLNEYDAYYYNQEGLRSLPVLRVRYADASNTWLYLDPQHGAMTKHDQRSRLNRWLYHGFHSLDFPFLYYRRPLWDIVVIGFSLGGIALSAATLVPAGRRLVRHARRFRRLGHGLLAAKRTPQVPVSGGGG